MQEESKQPKQVEELASDFASRFVDKTDDTPAWKMFYDSAMHFYNVGRAESEKYDVVNQHKEMVLREQATEISTNLMIAIYSNNAFMKELLNDVEEKAGQGVLASVAVKQAVALIKEVNKIKSFT